MITTQSNKPLLLCKGFCYTIDKITGDKIYWKCEFIRKLKCKSRIHTNSINTIILHENNDHNHCGNAVSGEVRLFEEKIRDHAVSYNESTQTVIDNCLDNLSDDTVARIPKFKHIKRNIQNLRNKNNLPNIPQDKIFDRTPDILAQTKRNDKFLQFDSVSGNQIFSSHENSQEW